jgi:hypothetical protein
MLIKKCKWWIFYKSNKESIKKLNLKRSIKWLFIILQKNKLVKAEKYSMGNKIKEWNSISEFKIK